MAEEKLQPNIVKVEVIGDQPAYVGDQQRQPGEIFEYDTTRYGNPGSKSLKLLEGKPGPVKAPVVEPGSPHTAAIDAALAAAHGQVKSVEEKYAPLLEKLGVKTVEEALMKLAQASQTEPTKTGGSGKTGGSSTDSDKK
jgi:hypothetical protein